MIQNHSKAASAAETLYFAYGSNLSLAQMQARCPGSTYYGFGVLRSWRWIINERGYANVVRIEGENGGESAASSDAVEKKLDGEGGNGAVAAVATAEGEEEAGDEEDEEGVHSCVEGMLYILTGRDESRLDAAEGVPYAYIKLKLDVELISTATAESGSDTPKHLTGAASDVPGFVEALVYVDLKRKKKSVCKLEYVARMNRGIVDARSRGMSERYVETVLRRWIPEVKEDRDSAGEVADPFAPSD